MRVEYIAEIGTHLGAVCTEMKKLLQDLVGWNSDVKNHSGRIKRASEVVVIALQFGSGVRSKLDDDAAPTLFLDRFLYHVWGHIQICLIGPLILGVL